MRNVEARTRYIHSETERQILGSIFNTSSSPVLHQLRLQETKAIFNPKKIPSLDIAFTKRSQSQTRLSPVVVFDIPNCVGISLPNGHQEGMEESIREIFEQETDLPFVSVIVDTADNLLNALEAAKNANWESQDINLQYVTIWLQEIAGQNDELVEKQPQPYQQQILIELEEKMNAAKNLLFELGVEPSTVKPINLNGGIMLLFETATDDLSIVPMMNVIEYTRESEETITSSGKVIGVYVPPEGEDLFNSFQKCENFKLDGNIPQLGSHFPLISEEIADYSFRPTIAIASKNQLHLWQQHGFFGNLESYRGPEAVPLEEVVDFLQSEFEDYLDIQCHRVHGQEVDAMFTNPRPTRPNELMPINIKTLDNDRTYVMENVVGFFCCERSLLDVQRKELASGYAKQIRPFHPDHPELKILGVNQEIFQLWQDMKVMGQSF